jgi:hypothetical protein
MLVQHCDFHFVYQEFDHIGTPHGLRTNWDKSGALVTLDPSDVQTNQDYLDGISLLLPSKIYTHGTTFLGTPLGHPSFIHSHLMEVADEFDKRCKGLQSQLDDLQTKTSLFCMCLQGTIPHLLMPTLHFVPNLHSTQSTHMLGHPHSSFA